MGTNRSRSSAVLAAVALALAACSGGDGGGAGTSTVKPGTTTPATGASTTSRPATPTSAAGHEGSAAAGEHPVGVAMIDGSVDEEHDRTVPLKVYFPADLDGAAPVVVVSHGGTGTERSREAYEYLGRALASHGYVAIHPSHTRQDGVPLTVSRPWEVSFVVDLVEAGSLEIAGFDGTLDAERIGHAGHSFGAYTVMAVAGAKVDVPEAYGGSDAVFRDERVGAFLALSPSGAGQFGLEDGSWEEIAAPVYVIYGELEEDSDGRGNVEVDGWRGQAFDGMPPGDKYESVIPGAAHFNFNDRGGRGAGDPAEAYTLRFVAENGLAFFDTYLRGDPRREEIGTLGDVTGVRSDSK